MDIQRRQNENMGPHSLAKKHLQEKQRNITDFQRHQATLADNFDTPLSSSMKQYERGITTDSDKRGDHSWQGAPKARMNDGGGGHIGNSSEHYDKKAVNELMEILATPKGYESVMKKKTSLEKILTNKYVNEDDINFA